MNREEQFKENLDMKTRMWNDHFKRIYEGKIILEWSEGKESFYLLMTAKSKELPVAISKTEIGEYSLNDDSIIDRIIKEMEIKLTRTILLEALQ